MRKMTAKEEHTLVARLFCKRRGQHGHALGLVQEESYLLSPDDVRHDIQVRVVDLIPHLGVHTRPPDKMVDEELVLRRKLHKPAAQRFDPCRHFQLLDGLLHSQIRNIAFFLGGMWRHAPDADTNAWQLNALWRDGQARKNKRGR